MYKKKGKAPVPNKHSSINALQYVVWMFVVCVYHPEAATFNASKTVACVDSPSGGSRGAGLITGTFSALNLSNKLNWNPVNPGWKPFPDELSYVLETGIGEGFTEKSVVRKALY